MRVSACRVLPELDPCRQPSYRTGPCCSGYCAQGPVAAGDDRLYSRAGLLRSRRECDLVSGSYIQAYSLCLTTHELDCAIQPVTRWGDSRNGVLLWTEESVLICPIYLDALTLTNLTICSRCPGGLRLRHVERIAAFHSPDNETALGILCQRVLRRTIPMRLL